MQGGYFYHICFCLNQLRMQDTVLSTDVACCGSTQWKRHTHTRTRTQALWPVKAIVLTKRPQTHTCLTLLLHTKKNMRTHTGCNRHTQTAKSANSRDRVAMITCGGEGEELGVAPPAARRRGLQHPRPSVTAPRQRKTKGLRTFLVKKLN